MKLNIRKSDLIRDIQRDFTAIYPYLKIEFFKRPHPDKKLSSREDLIGSMERVGELGRIIEAMTIDISGKRTVNQLEQDFQQLAGLSVQVYRKSAGLWIETSLTDDWTLERQNQEGEMMGLSNDELETIGG